MGILTRFVEVIVFFIGLSVNFSFAYKESIAYYKLNGNGNALNEANDIAHGTFRIVTTKIVSKRGDNLYYN